MEIFRPSGMVLKRLVAAKKATHSKTPFIELQFLVMRHNEHQMNKMREFAKQTQADKAYF